MITNQKFHDNQTKCTATVFMNYQKVLTVTELKFFFQTKFISIRVRCASLIHHCLPPTLSKQSSMKNWRNQRVRVLHYPQILTTCYELKVFPSLRVFSYDANKHWKQRNHPNPTYRYLLFVFLAWWGKITTHFYSFQRKTNKN